VGVQQPEGTLQLEGTIVTAPFGKQIPTFHVPPPPVIPVAMMQALVEVHADGLAKDAKLHCPLPHCVLPNAPLLVVAKLVAVGLFQPPSLGDPL
jgi:hypothetical protein